MEEQVTSTERQKLDIRQVHLSHGQQQELLGIARQAIKTFLEKGRLPESRSADPTLHHLAGVFVTLWQREKHSSDVWSSDSSGLRGCIGHVEADRSLDVVVAQMAAQSATADWRFHSLTSEDLEHIVIEISVLSPLEQVTDLDRQVVIGEHGLLVEGDGRRGLLLPSVATRYNWTPQQFADNVCYKAGLPSGFWRRAGRLHLFSTQVFEERH